MLVGTKVFIKCLFFLESHICGIKKAAEHSAALLLSYIAYSAHSSIKALTAASSCSSSPLVMVLGMFLT